MVAALAATRRTSHQSESFGAGRSGMESSIRPLIEWIVPQALRQQPAKHRQAKRVVAFVLAMMIWVPTYVIIFQSLGAPLSRNIVACAGVAFVLTLALLHAGGSPAWCANVFVGTAWLTYGAIALATGGPLSPATMWFVSVPLLAVWLAGGRAGVIWTLLSLLMISALALAREYDVGFHNEVTPRGFRVLEYLGLVGIVCCVLVLISVLRRIEDTARERLHQARLRAESADRAKTQFLANTSHEIRTPMTAILGYAELLSRDLDRPELAIDRAEALDTIRRNGEHLLQLVSDILDVARIEAGQLSLEYHNCSPVQLARDVLATMRDRAKSQNLRLEFTVQEPMPAQNPHRPHALAADPHQRGGQRDQVHQHGLDSSDRRAGTA